MKFKLTVLALLMVGFVLGASSPAFAEVVISKATTSMASASVEIAATGIPAAVVKYTNNGAATVTMDKISLQTGGTYDAVGDFQYSVWHDKDKNGVVSWGDTKVKATADLPDVGSANPTVLIDLDPNVAIPGSGGTMYMIVVVDIVGASDGETVTIGADGTPGNNVATSTVIWTNASAPDAPTPGSVATITADTGSGTQSLTMAVADTPVEGIADVPNRTRSVALMNFKLTAGASYGQVLNAIEFTTGTNTSTSSVDEDDAIETVSFYIDKGNIGSIDGADIRVMAIDDTMWAYDNQFVLNPGVYIPPAGDLTMLVGVAMSGAGDTDDVIALDTDYGNFLANNNNDLDGTDVVADGDTLVAMSATWETADLQGPPHERANGYLDAIKITFKVGKSTKAVDDATVDDAVDEGEIEIDSDSYYLSFSPTYGGDVANNHYVYVKIDEEDTWWSTADTPSYDYSGEVDDDPNPDHRIISLDGQYGLPDVSGTTDDKAPPAPLVVETIDTEGNGKIDNLRFRFSDGEALYFWDGEDPVDWNSYDEGQEELGFSIPLYYIDTDAQDMYPYTVVVYVDEGDDYDTGVTPPYQYSGTVGIIMDSEGNKVLSFNQNDIPVTDKAAPKLWHVKTIDNDLDGMFDRLQLDFSEPVQLNPAAALTAASLTKNTEWDTEGFFFGEGHIDAYDFTGTGNAGVGTAQLIFPVNEVGSFDTGVLPSLVYIGTDSETSPLVDMAASPMPLWMGDYDYWYPVLEFDMLDSEDDIEYAEDVWLEDGISPKITGAAWLDDDGDGKLDTAALTFSEPMGSDLASYEDLDIEGHDVESAEVVGANVYVEVDETGYDTGMTPDITYDDDSIVDSHGAPLLALESDSVDEIDNAFPVIYEAKTADMGYGSVDGSGAHNGKIDGMVLKFSEPMNTDKLDKKGSDPDEMLKGEFETTTHAVNDTVKFTDSQTAVIYLVEDGTPENYDTDVIPQLRYWADGDSNLADMVGLLLADIEDDDDMKKETDGAPPVPVMAKTLDIIRWDLTRSPIRMYNNYSDGYLDGVIITFSELLRDVDTAQAATGVWLADDDEDPYPIELDLSGIEIDDRTDPEVANVVVDSFTVQIIGQNEMGNMAWDTGELPYIMIDAANGIADTLGNIVAAVDMVPTTDGAEPILAKALARIDSKYIDIWFSEPVTNDLGGDIDEEDFQYGGDTLETEIVGIEGAEDEYTLETEDVIPLAAAVSDWVSVLDDTVIDAVGLICPSMEVSILDAVAPVLTDAMTQDVNGDGWVDHIKLTFSEPIKDENINGNPVFEGMFFARDSKLINAFTAENFNIIGINLCGDYTYYDEEEEEDVDVDGDDLAQAVTNYLRSQKILTTKQSVLNVMDVADDNVLWLMVTGTEEVTPGEGDTDLTSTLSMVAGPGGSGIGDFRPNYAEAVTGMSVPDRAGPAIIKAEMPSKQILHVWTSEPLQTPLGAADEVFDWEVGTEKQQYEGYIVNWSKVTGTTTQYEVVLFDVEVPYNSVSTLNFLNPDVVHDTYRYARNPNRYNGNIVAWDKVNVLPPRFDVAVEEEAEVPGVFALSKNFPNPFNPSTTINYDIADQGGHVSLVIYNMTGQTVRTLVDEAKTPGFYSVMWDGTDDMGATVSSGIYLYKIVCGDFSKIEKMTFVK